MAKLTARLVSALPHGARRIAYVLPQLIARFGSSSIEGRASIVHRSCRPITPTV